eukprot:scaffold43345_cov45-Phaeocystis_antarctica.AAC.1
MTRGRRVRSELRLYVRWKLSYCASVRLVSVWTPSRRGSQKASTAAGSWRRQHSAAITTSL